MSFLHREGQGRVSHYSNEGMTYKEQEAEVGEGPLPLV